MPPRAPFTSWINEAPYSKLQGVLAEANNPWTQGDCVNDPEAGRRTLILSPLFDCSSKGNALSAMSSAFRP
jgi:hypothetical protein